MQPALELTKRARDNIKLHWPRPDSDRRADLAEGQLARPEILPSFRLAEGESVFTLGSCFTTAIEDELVRRSFEVPCRAFEVPDHERDGLESGSVLTHHVPPVIYQELRRSMPGAPNDPGICLVETGDGRVVDTQLSTSVPVTRARGAERRAAVEALFRQAFTCGVAILTLGQIEAWWDDKTGLYCNQMPTTAVLKSNPDRFYLRTLGLGDVVESVSDTCELLVHRGRVTRILLTVSPVPMRRSWGHGDALTGYVYSKSLLRVAADTVAGRFPEVDYFPSFDMVMLSDRAAVFGPDRVSVRHTVAKEITSRMLDAYT